MLLADGLVDEVLHHLHVAENVVVVVVGGAAAALLARLLPRSRLLPGSAAAGGGAIRVPQPGAARLLLRLGLGLGPVGLLRLLPQVLDDCLQLALDRLHAVRALDLPRHAASGRLHRARGEGLRVGHGDLQRQRPLLQGLGLRLEVRDLLHQGDEELVRLRLDGLLERLDRRPRPLHRRLCLLRRVVVDRAALAVARGLALKLLAREELAQRLKLLLQLLPHDGDLLVDRVAPLHGLLRRLSGLCRHRRRLVELRLGIHRERAELLRLSLERHPDILGLVLFLSGLLQFIQQLHDALLVCRCLLKCFHDLIRSHLECLSLGQGLDGARISVSIISPTRRRTCWLLLRLVAQRAFPTCPQEEPSAGAV
mmetsp:Transcript_19394/g.46245  ORF Transcript_19394/g.46245 Transcript_19394/m.46245 type:complete len:367 (+) Transcript_19394:2115-3215(+)